VKTGKMASGNYDVYYASLVERLQHDFQIGRSEEKKAEERILEGEFLQSVLFLIDINIAQ